MSREPMVTDRAARQVTLQPAEAELRELSLTSAAARATRHGSVNVRTRVRARARRSTFVVRDTDHGGRSPVTATMLRADADRVARLQEDHLAETGQVVVDGYLGAPGPLRLGLRVVTETAFAWLAGMERHLLFDPVVAAPDFEPDLTVVCTPSLEVPGAPDGVLVIVWPEQGTTRVTGTDFFGETKKAATRMWSERVYDAGGLVLHAGCLVAPSGRGPSTVLVVGPPDSGKSTLVLRDPSAARLVQDDFVALLPGGRVVAAENGCIEKTWGCSARRQPVLHAAVTCPETYLENVPQRGVTPHFAASEGPRHSRAVFPLRSVGGLADDPVPPLALLLLLDPGHDLAPAAARIDHGQVPGYFLLRERGDQLAERSGRHGNRLAALLTSSRADAVVVNSSVVPRDLPGSPRLGAWPLLTALLAGSVSWHADEHLRVAAAGSVPGVPDPDTVWPRRRYERVGQMSEYARLLDDLRATWRGYLGEFAGLDPGIAAAVT